jgi:transcriptional regulator with XRE-family HTH domain
MASETARHPTPLHYIRTCVFKVAGQEEFGRIVGMNQASISLIEAGKRRLRYDVMCRIRKAAKKRRLDWSDSLFFEVPKQPRCERAEA